MYIIKDIRRLDMNDKKYVVEIRELEGDKLEQVSKPLGNRDSYKLEQAYDKRIDHNRYYSIRVEV
jgi:hypothetical protein